MFKIHKVLMLTFFFLISWGRTPNPLLPTSLQLNHYFWFLNVCPLFQNELCQEFCTHILYIGHVTQHRGTVLYLQQGEVCLSHAVYKWSGIIVISISNLKYSHYFNYLKSNTLNKIAAWWTLICVICKQLINLWQLWPSIPDPSKY